MGKPDVVFPLSNLNNILKCVAPGTAYSFNFILSECKDIEMNKGLFKEFGLNENIITESSEKIYTGIIELFTFQDENILTIDVTKMADSARKYFESKPNLNLESHYSEMEIYDFLDFLNNNPVCAEMNSKIVEISEKKGSFFVFQLQKEDKNLFDDFIFADIPANYKNIHVDFTFSGYAFDSILQSKSDCIPEYPFPFSIFDNPGKLEELKQSNYQLAKNALVEVHLDPHDEMMRNGIFMNYSFYIKFDILTGELIP